MSGTQIYQTGAHGIVPTSLEYRRPARLQWRWQVRPALAQQQLTPNHLELRLRQIIEAAQTHDSANTSAGRPIASITTMAVPWTSPVPAAVKGIIRVPAHNTPIKAS